MTEDAALRKAVAAWLAQSRPKDVPRSSKRVLESAERRLVAAINRGDTRSTIAQSAERVRRAQLGCLKAQARVAELPTDIDDDGLRRRQANLAAARSAWESASIDEIVARYEADLQK